MTTQAHCLPSSIGIFSASGSVLCIASTLVCFTQQTVELWLWVSNWKCWYSIFVNWDVENLKVGHGELAECLANVLATVVERKPESHTQDDAGPPQVFWWCQCCGSERDFDRSVGRLQVLVQESKDCRWTRPIHTGAGSSACHFFLSFSISTQLRGNDLVWMFFCWISLSSLGSLFCYICFDWNRDDSQGSENRPWCIHDLQGA